MIKLTELYFSKESLFFQTEPILVNIDSVSTIKPNKITMRAPTQVASKIFGDEVPDEYYKKLASTECTTIKFIDGSYIDVAETLKEIEKLIGREE